MGWGRKEGNGVAWKGAGCDDMGRDGLEKVALDGMGKNWIGRYGMKRNGKR